jgi:putative ABC transport system ATP-binding protein
LILSLEDVRKTYDIGDSPVEALRGVSFSVGEGDFVACMGPSGCGKSTLLHVCGAMDRPTTGSVAVEGINLANLTDDQLTLMRRDRIGFVFQFFNLLPTLTVEENVALPLLLAGTSDRIAFGKARELAGRVGLGTRLAHYPAQLSGGEMQRTAIARAIIHRPALVLADEPTGNLDSVNGALVLRLLQELNQEMNVTVLMATHTVEIAQASNRIIHMKDGSIQHIQRVDRTSGSELAGSATGVPL